MLFDSLLNRLGYRKIVKSPTYSEFVKKKEDRVEYLKTLAVPLIKKIVDDFVNNGEFVSSIIRHIYLYRDMQVEFAFHGWGCLEKKGYEYEFADRRDTLRFSVHERYQLYKFDYAAVFYEELAKSLNRYELTVKLNEQYGEHYIVPLNEDTDKRAMHCLGAMAVS